MAVYTQLNHSALTEVCAMYQLGEIVDYRGIEDGIENTTYFIDFQKNGTITSTVLTVFEYMSAEALPFFIQLTTKLAGNNLAVPCPICAPDGTAISHVGGKPALLYPRAKGGHVTEPSASQCAEIGRYLANMHNAHQDSPVINQLNIRGIDWQRETAASITAELPDDEQQLIGSYFDQLDQELNQYHALPSGVIHADLFHDNALFNEGRLSAVIDFYFAGSDAFLLDLAIVANDWCWQDEEVGYNQEKLSALVDAYVSVRSLTQEEIALWSLVVRIAMMRFWLSRRVDEIQNTGRRLKSAFQLRRRLEFLITNPAELPTIR